MKIGALICVLMLSFSVVPAGVERGAFEPARRVGEAGERTFFIFSTSTAEYWIRHDGMGEVALNGRRRVIYLKVGTGGRLERMYFREHEGDLLLLYEVSDAGGGMSYLARINQHTRKSRWLTPIEGKNFGPCLVEGNEVNCGAPGELKIDLKTGSQLKSG